MIPKMASLALALLSVILLVFSAQAARAPRSEKEIPIYPGAMRDRGAEAEARAEEERFRLDDLGQYRFVDLEQNHEEGPLIPRSSSTLIYRIAAPAEEVLRFYLRELGGTEGDGSQYLYDGTTAPGTVSPFQTFDEKGNKKVQTSIIVKKTTYMNPADARKAVQKWRDEEEEQEEIAHADTVRKLAGSQFKPEDVGVPVYPGARRDGNATQVLRETLAMDGAAFRSADDVLKVAEFYERQSGLKLIHADGKGALLRRCEEEYNEFLKRMMSIDCDAEITIQNPWMDMKSGKLVNDTLISIVNLTE